MPMKKLTKKQEKELINFIKEHFNNILSCGNIKPSIGRIVKLR